MQDYREIESDIRDACCMYRSATMAQYDAFNILYKSKNIITPNTIGLYQRGKYVIEVSWGRDMNDRPMYGVTVAEHTGHSFIRSNDLSRPFSSLVEMTDYINHINR